MIPPIVWPLLLAACVAVVVMVVDCHRINRRRDLNRNSIEAERIARENAAPLGNAERVW